MGDSAVHLLDEDMGLRCFPSTLTMMTFTLSMGRPTDSWFKRWAYFDKIIMDGSQDEKPRFALRAFIHSMPPWSRLVSKTLANTGSTARDHLASERTFLAWLRTGLGFIALGIAVERFSQLDPQRFSSSLKLLENTSQEAVKEESGLSKREQWLVGALIGTGAGSIGYGTTRYFSNMKALQQGLYKPAVYGAGSLSVAMTTLAGAAVWSALKD